MLVQILQWKWFLTLNYFYFFNVYEIFFANIKIASFCNNLYQTALLLLWSFTILTLEIYSKLPQVTVTREAISSSSKNVTISSNAYEVETSIFNKEKQSKLNVQEYLHYAASTDVLKQVLYDFVAFLSNTYKAQKALKAIASKTTFSHKLKTSQMAQLKPLGSLSIGSDQNFIASVAVSSASFRSKLYEVAITTFALIGFRAEFVPERSNSIFQKEGDTAVIRKNKAHFTRPPPLFS